MNPDELQLLYSIILIGLGVGVLAGYLWSI